MNLSVIIPTYNRKTFLLDAIESIDKQTIAPNEIIVIDDGSNDNTHEAIKPLKHICYYYQTNKGVSVARNNGIKKAHNEWIALLDSDDLWHPSKIEKQIQFHQKNPHILISHTNEHWLRKGQTVHQKTHHKKPYGFCFKENIPFCKIGPSTVLMHKSIFDTIGYFDPLLLACEDYDLWLRVSKEYEIGYINEPLTIKQAGDHNQLSVTTVALDQYRIQALEKHLNIPDDQTLIINELIKKTTLLLKGAHKHNNKRILQQYQPKLDYYKRCQKKATL